MVFKKFFKKKDREFYREEAYRPQESTKGNSDYVPFYETSNFDLKDNKNKFSVKVFRLESQDSVREILDRVRDGKTICLIDISTLKNRDPEELRRAIHKIKKTSEVVDGEVVGFSPEWVLASPENVSIEKNK